MVFSSLALAQNIETTTANFYNGLSDIMERHLNAPDQCVKQAKQFIDKNKKIFDYMSQAVKEGQKQFSGGDLSEKSIKNAQAQAQNSVAYQAATRWMKVFMDFSMKYPEHAAKIGGYISQYVPQQPTF